MMRLLSSFGTDNDRAPAGALNTFGAVAFDRACQSGALPPMPQSSAFVLRTPPLKTKAENTPAFLTRTTLEATM